MSNDQPPAAVLAYLNSCARFQADGVTFHDPLYGPHLATEREGAPPRTAAEVAHWTRANRPDLWAAETAKALPTNPATATGSQEETVTALMIRAGRGDGAALSKLTAKAGEQAKHQSVAPTTRTTDINFTHAMTKAKGDPAAVQALLAQIGGRR